MSELFWVNYKFTKNKVYLMCLDIIRNPSKALADAKKKNSMGKTLTVLLEASILMGLAAGVLAAKAGLFDTTLVLSSIIAVFLASVIGILLFGLIIYITATTLGGRGKYFEGLTSTAYALLPISAGMFIISLLAWVPFALGLQIIVLAVTLALGISILHRGIKELYKTDMVTSFVTVSIAAFVLLVALYFSLALSLLNRLAAGVI